MNVVGAMNVEGRTTKGLLIDDLRLTNKKNKEENNTSNFQNRYRFKSTQDIIEAAEGGHSRKTGRV